jgi:hypothetical protein
MSWRSGSQVSDTEPPEYTTLIAGFQIEIRREARYVKMRVGSIKQKIIGIEGSI